MYGIHTNNNNHNLDNKATNKLYNIKQKNPFFSFTITVLRFYTSQHYTFFKVKNVFMIFLFAAAINTG